MTGIKYSKSFYVVIVEDAAFQFAAVVILQNALDLIGQVEETEQVGDDHQGIERIGKHPDDIDFLQGAQEDENRDQNLIRKDTFRSEQVFDVRFAEVVPTDDCREGEEG